MTASAETADAEFDHSRQVLADYRDVLAVLAVFNSDRRSRRDATPRR